MMSKSQRGGEKMKANLEFNLPEDQESFDDAVNGWKWSHAMWQLDQFLRAKVKYASDEASEESINAFQDARDELHRILSEENLEMR
jgi:hypothetical protein